MKNRTGFLASTLILLNVSIAAGQDIDAPRISKGLFLPAPKIVRSQIRTSALTSVQIYDENFESGGAGWSLTGSWEIGAPTTGPLSGHNSTNLAATDLDANYLNSADDWLISPAINLPSLTHPATELKLYFWEWFSTESGFDEIRLKISTDNGINWTELSSVSGSSGDWIETMHDLTVYAGQSIKIGFNLTPDGSITSEGWYIDDIRIELEEPQPLEAACVSLNHQIFPFIFLNVAVDTFGAGISSLTLSDLEVFENGVLQTEHFNVIPPQSGGGARVADIVFIMDNSGSMSDEQAAIRNNVIDFVDNLSASGIDFALGLTRYGGENGGLPIFEDNGVLTTNPVYFKDNVWLRNNISGSFEPGYLAMVQSASNFSFRPGAQRIFIIITDETPAQGGTTQSEAISVLQSNSITLFTLTEPFLFSDFDPVADATNGRVFDIFSNFDEILNFIVAQVANTYVVSYYSSDPFNNGIERLVEVVVSHNLNQATCGRSYIPGSAPKIKRTMATLNLHSQAWTAGTSFTIEVDITDDVSPFVRNAALLYKNTTDTTFNSVSMTNTSGDLWEASIPSGFSQDPGVDYYITATDSLSTVSDPSSDPISNPYQIAILPNVAPQITHTPVTALTPGVTIFITAEITDNTNVLSETILQYRKQGQLVYIEVNLINTSGDTYGANIPVEFVTSDGVEYFIKATDNFGVSSIHGTPDKPHRIGGIEPPPTSVIFLYPNPSYLLPPSFDLTSDVMLAVDQGENVLGVESDISYDPSLVEIIDFEPAEFLSLNGAIITDLSTFDNATGMLNVQLTAAGGSPAGVTGDGNLAKITFKAKALDPTSDLLLSGASLRDPANVTTIPGMQNGAFALINDLLFDLDSDNDVDFADFTLLVAYWNEVPDNLAGDRVGPITGLQPGLPPWSKTNYLYPGDGVIDFEDQIVFTLMYNWYKQQTDALSPIMVLSSVADTQEKALMPVGTNFVTRNDEFSISVPLENLRDVIGFRFLLEYDSEILAYIGNNLDEIMGINKSAVSTFDKIETNLAEINHVIMGSRGVRSDFPVTVEFRFRAVSRGKSKLNMKSIDLRDRNNNSVSFDYSNYSAKWDIIVLDTELLPVEFILSQNHPNPFNPSTSIEYSLPEVSEVLLVIYNLGGKEVVRLVDSVQSAGYHKITWNASDMASGVYLYRLQSGDFVQTRKMILLK